MSIYIPDAVNGDLAAIELVLFKYSADITIMNTFSLEEKSVIITGGLGGYGLAICELILKRKGRVLLTDLKSDSEAEEILSKCCPHMETVTKLRRRKYSGNVRKHVERKKSTTHVKVVIH